MTPRLPEKEALLVAELRERPQTIDELRRVPLVRSKIGRGYLGPMLSVLLEEQTLAVTNGVFWVRRPSERPNAQEVPLVNCEWCAGVGTVRCVRCALCAGVGKVRP